MCPSIDALRSARFGGSLLHSSMDVVSSQETCIGQDNRHRAVYFMSQAGLCLGYTASSELFVKSYRRYHAIRLDLLGRARIFPIAEVSFTTCI